MAKIGTRATRFRHGRKPHTDNTFQTRHRWLWQGAWASQHTDDTVFGDAGIDMISIVDADAAAGRIAGAQMAHGEDAGFMWFCPAEVDLTKAVYFDCIVYVADTAADDVFGMDMTYKVHTFGNAAGTSGTVYNIDASYLSTYVTDPSDITMAHATNNDEKFYVLTHTLAANAFTDAIKAWTTTFVELVFTADIGGELGNENSLDTFELVGVAYRYTWHEY